MVYWWVRFYRIYTQIIKERKIFNKEVLNNNQKQQQRSPHIIYYICCFPGVKVIMKEFVKFLLGIMSLSMLPIIVTLYLENFLRYYKKKEIRDRVLR